MVCFQWIWQTTEKMLKTGKDYKLDEVYAGI